MNKNIKIEDYQSDIKQGNYEKIMDIIEGRALDLIKEIAAEQNIELSLENNANKEKSIMPSFVALMVIILILSLFRHLWICF